MSADEQGPDKQTDQGRKSGSGAASRAKKGTKSPAKRKSPKRKKAAKATQPVTSDDATELEDAQLEDGELGDGEEDEFAGNDSEQEPNGELSDDADGLDGFDADLDENEEDIDAVVALSAKEQNARSLEVRRAIEERMEQRKLDEDLDYLDLEFD